MKLLRLISLLYCIFFNKIVQCPRNFQLLTRSLRIFANLPSSLTTLIGETFAKVQKKRKLNPLNVKVSEQIN